MTATLPDRFMPGTGIEVVRRDWTPGQFRSVLFDFDGTLSLIREGWPEVMIPMMVEILRATGTRETESELRAIVEDFVMRLNGRQTIYQMIELDDHVRQRGGQPSDPLDYKHQFNALLGERLKPRLVGLRSGELSREQLTVPQTHSILARLCERGMILYLASGTDVANVREEAALLGLTEFFGERIFGALDHYKNFSKQMIIDRILREQGLRGGELLAFGDGFVEIEEVKKVGGVAVGVASDEIRRAGVDAWKRNRLIQAGADIIVGDYCEQDGLLKILFDP